MRAGLEEVRGLTLRLVDDLADAAARKQVHPGYSPLSWHLGHVAWQEEVWALRRSAGQPPIDSRLDGIYDSFRSPKCSRDRRLPPLREIVRYAARVRERTLHWLEKAEIGPDAPEPLLRDGYVFRFLANHERQHVETMATIRLLARLPVRNLAGPRGSAEPDDAFVEVPGGSFVQGSDDDPEGWDNERRAHEVQLAPFRIARDPVRNAAWLEFLEAGGYRDDRLWDPAGIAWRDEARIGAPLHWRKTDGWQRFTLRGWQPLRLSDPVSHVSWFEARAFARFAGARLPSESEWERAAAGSDRDETNLFLAEGDVCSCEHAASRCGARGMLGNVWEWTADDFGPYPGFEPDAYRGYSAPWFGDRHKVLRGGCWLTHPAIARVTFRNWFEPQVREFPSGLRLVSGRA